MSKTTTKKTKAKQIAQTFPDHFSRRKMFRSLIIYEVLRDHTESKTEFLFFLVQILQTSNCAKAIFVLIKV